MELVDLFFRSLHPIYKKATTFVCNLKQITAFEIGLYILKQKKEFLIGSNIYVFFLTYLRAGVEFKGPTPTSYVVNRNLFPDFKEYDLHLSVTTIFGTTENTSTSIRFKEGIIISQLTCWSFYMEEKSHMLVTY